MAATMTAVKQKRVEGADGQAAAAGPLSPEELRKLHAYWRAANYLSVGQLLIVGQWTVFGPMLEPASQIGRQPNDRALFLILPPVWGIEVQEAVFEINLLPHIEINNCLGSRPGVQGDDVIAAEHFTTFTIEQ